MKSLNFDLQRLKRWLRRTLVWQSLALAFLAMADPACAADVRRWSFEATVFQLDGEFGDVRLGDPVSGLFSYDLDTEPEFSEPGQIAGYGHPASFAGLRVAIENPRTETELHWEPHTDFYVQVHTDADPFFEQSAILV